MLDLQGVLAEAGQPPENGFVVFLLNNGATALPVPLLVHDGSLSPSRIALHVAGHAGTGGGAEAGGWAAVALETDPYGTLTAPVRLWKGTEAAPTHDRLEALALCAALSALAEDALALPVTITLPRDPGAFGMKDRLTGWRNAGWIGERWTKIPNVDLWRQIDAYADRLAVSWQPFPGLQPGLWDCIAAAIAKRAAAPVTTTTINN